MNKSDMSMTPTSKAKPPGDQKVDDVLCYDYVRINEPIDEDKKVSGPTTPLFISKSPMPTDPIDQVSMACAALESTARVVLGKRQYDPKVLTTLRSALAGRSMYKFRVSRLGSVTSGSGTFAVPIQTDLTQYSEGSTLQLLFDECRLDETMFKHVTYDPSTTAANRFGFVVGFENSINTTTPTAPFVARLPQSKLYHTFDTTGKEHITHGYVAKRPWGDSAQEGSLSKTILSGGDGNWSLAVFVGTPQSSTVYLGYAITSVFSLRSRNRN